MSTDFDDRATRVYVAITDDDDPALDEWDMRVWTWCALAAVLFAAALGVM